MTNKDEALKMAIEALENSLTIQDVAINACKEALEQPEGKEFFERGKEIARWADKQAQEPVGQLCLGCGTSMTDARLDAEKRHNAQLISCCPDRKMVDVYTHPHQNEASSLRASAWQGLTDDEIRNIDVDTRHFMVFARAIEVKLKEKNYD